MPAPQIPQQRIEELGPAERIINAITQYTDHAVHNRPGVVFTDNRSKTGVRWEAATWVTENDGKVVYVVKKNGKRQTKSRIGVGVPGTDEVRNGNGVVARFRGAGLFPEVVAYLYRQIAEVWKLDNEFAAKWASWAFEHDENRDLKVLLAAFLLVQNRFGEQIGSGAERLLDDDYRAVGEALCLRRNSKKQSFNPKLLLRVGEVLALPEVAAINRELGFGSSARRATMGRYTKLVEKWLANCEANPKVLEALVKGGFRTSVMALARRVGYKPMTPRFFEVLRWKQVQAKDGRRTLAIGQEVKAADTWEGLTEAQICTKIVAERPNYKLIAGKLPSAIGLTPAIMAAAITAGCLSDVDLLILTPTLEELGLLENQAIKTRWQQASEKAESQRAANIARNVKSQEVKKELEEAADKATAKAVEEVARGLRFYVVVDKSGSMENSIEKAKGYLKKFVGAMPLDRLHVSIFNTVGSEIRIQQPTAAAVEQAFRGHRAGGGTCYAAGVHVLLQQYKPAADEDAFIIFVGDQLDDQHQQLARCIRDSGVQPVAFGLLSVTSEWNRRYPNVKIVEQAAAQLGIPCLPIDEQIFADPYAVPRTIRNLIASTPVGRPAAGAEPRKRVSLIEQILQTPLLQKPAWA